MTSHGKEARSLGGDMTITWHLMTSHGMEAIYEL